MSATAKWKTEGDMCQYLMDTLRSEGWKVYPECHEFDILVISPKGVRYGIEAKLKANMHVLCQLLDKAKNRVVHHRVSLTPTFDGGFARIANALGIGVLATDNGESAYLYGRSTTLGWYLEMCCSRLTPNAAALIALPDIDIQGPAGVPSPKKLTKWKLAAVRFCLDHIGSQAIERQMLPAAGLSPALWVKQKWIVPCGSRPGDKGKAVTLYRLGDAADGCMRPDLLYPEIADALRDLDKRNAA